MNLAHEPCEACRPGSPAVGEDELPMMLAAVPGWTLVTVNEVPRLKRVIRVDGWEPAVDLAVRIAALASESDHHPSIRIEWGKVTVQWWTHAIRGLHRNDFIMAARVNDLAAVQ